MAAPAFEPNSSVASCAASVSLAAPLRLSCISCSASFIGLPSLVAFFKAFFRPARTVCESAPDLSSSARNITESSSPNPISCNAVAFFFKVSASFSSGTPVFCPAAVNRSSTSGVFSTSVLNAAIADWIVSMELLTSVSFMSANSKNRLESSSSSSPVTPKRVLTSPTAVPTSSNVTGIDVAISRTVCCISSNASPVAPVFLVTISSALSTSFHDATEAAPMAAIGPVTYFVSLPPTSFMPSPSFCILSPTAFIF